MSNDASPRLNLPYLAAAQAQKHVTLNEALSLLDGLILAAVESRSVAVEPVGPPDGSLYLLPAGASGQQWSSLEPGALARVEAGAWTALAVPFGRLIYLLDESRLLMRTAAGWTDPGLALRALANLDRLGVGATADAANPVSVSAPAALFSHAGASIRLTLNKAAAANTGSVLFQSGWSGRAEFGLTGDDNLHLKVSADGVSWRESLVVSRSDGALGLGPAYYGGVPLMISGGPKGQVNLNFWGDAGASASGAVLFGANLYPLSDDNTIRLRAGHPTLGGGALLFNRAGLNTAQIGFSPPGAADQVAEPVASMTWMAADRSSRAEGPFYPASYATTALPAASSCPGALATDATLNKLVRSNGAAWVALG